MLEDFFLQLIKISTPDGGRGDVNYVGGVNKLNMLASLFYLSSTIFPHLLVILTLNLPFFPFHLVGFVFAQPITPLSILPL